MKRSIFFIPVLFFVAVAILSTAVSTAAVGGTEVYVSAAFVISASKMPKALEARRQTVLLAQLRAARAQMSGVDVFLNQYDELQVKAKNVADPEGFRTFITRQGVWKIVDEQGTQIFAPGRVGKTTVDPNEAAPRVGLLISKGLNGAPKDAADGVEFPVTLIMDGENIAMTLKVANGGKSVALWHEGMTIMQAWQLRALLSTEAYPFPLKVTNFKSGDDILKSIFG